MPANEHNGTPLQTLSKLRKFWSVKNLYIYVQKKILDNKLSLTLYNCTYIPMCKNNRKKCFNKGYLDGMV